MRERLCLLGLIPFGTVLRAEEARPYFTVSPWLGGADAWAGQPPIRKLTAEEKAALPSRVDNSDRVGILRDLRGSGPGKLLRRSSAPPPPSPTSGVLKGASAPRCSPKNRFLGSVFTWNFFNGGDGSGSEAYQGWEIFRTVGVPSEAVYGGWRSPAPASWPSDFPIWLDALRHRAAAWTFTRVHDADSLAEVKGWLFNHNRKGDVRGGVCVVDGAVLNVRPEHIPAGAYEAGKAVWANWPKTDAKGGHIMTLVGYDDNVVFDRNGDGRITTDVDINHDGKVDLADSERGAFIVVNSWGEGFGNRGKIYIPYGTVADTTWFRAPWLGRVVTEGICAASRGEGEGVRLPRSRQEKFCTSRHGVADAPGAAKPERVTASPIVHTGEADPGDFPHSRPPHRRRRYRSRSTSRRCSRTAARRPSSAASS